jgi:hypothetical protein
MTTHNLKENGMTNLTGLSARFISDAQAVTRSIDQGITFDEGRSTGARMVASNGWSTSASSCRGVVTIRAVRWDDSVPNRWGGLGAIVERHPLDGLDVDSDDEAWRLLYEAGVLAFMFWVES